MKRTRKLAITGIFSGIAYVLMLLEFPLAFVIPSFVKFDFSELPALICSFAAGPLCGVAVCFIKNLLHALVSQSAGIGELANFILGAIFIFTAGTVYKKFKTKTGALLASLIGSVSGALLSLPVNLFITYPFYMNFMSESAILGMYRALIPWIKSLAQALLVFNVPFTFIKFATVSAITFLIYKRISPLIKGKK